MAHRNSDARSVVGAGFVAVDVQARPGTCTVAAGGTSANVVRGLARRGWSAAHVGWLGDDAAGELVRTTLRADGVATDGVELSADRHTPVLTQTTGHGDHGWRYACPVCAARTGRFRATPQTHADAVLARVDVPDVFYFDRPTLFTLALATAWRAAGAFVMFEPDTAERADLFARAAALADLVKFSEERGALIGRRLADVDTMQVVTRGASGVRYRAGAARAWLPVDASAVSTLVDSAGAGDWATVGLLDTLLPVRRAAHEDPVDRLPAALAAAADSGARACGWRGVFPEAGDTVAHDEFERRFCPDAHRIRMRLERAA